MKYFLLVLILIIPLFSSLLRPGFFPMQDNMQAFRIYELSRCLSDGQIPCRWVPDMGFGYGYPLFVFYAPAPYYLGALFHILGLSYLDSVKALIILGFILSAAGAYLFLSRWLPGRLSAFVGALLYLIVPVRSVQVYVRGSLSEFLSLAIIPWLFWATLLWRRRSPLPGLIAASFFAALLLLTHNLTSYIVLPLWLIWSLFFLPRVRRWWPILSLIFACGLSAFFLLPLVWEHSLVHLESLVGGYFGYAQHFVSLSRLFLSLDWGYGSSAVGSGQDLSLSLGLMHWLLPLGLWLLISLRRFKELSLTLVMFSLFSLGLIFLIHRRSQFIWSLFPLLAYLQFPWRLLTPLAFFLSAVSAILFTIIPARLAKIIGIFAVAISLNLYGPWFRPFSWLTVDDSWIFSPVEFSRQQTVSIFDYLPRVAQFPPQKPAPDLPEILVGRANITAYRHNSVLSTARVDVTQAPVILRWPIFSYPGWQVYLNGQPLPPQPSDCRGQPFCYGLISFALPEATSYQVKLIWQNPPWRQTADWISAASFIIWIALAIKSIRYAA